MAIVAVLAFIFGFPFVGATASYIGARVLLPDMGLGVPGYWKFYWAAFFVTIVWGVLAFCWEAVKEAL